MENTNQEQELFRTYCQKRLSDKKEFRNLYYEILYNSEEEGKGITHLQAFMIINRMYFEMTGKLRYKNYLEFCIDRIRTDNIKRRKNLTTDPT